VEAWRTTQGLEKQLTEAKGATTTHDNNTTNASKERTLPSALEELNMLRSQTYLTPTKLELAINRIGRAISQESKKNLTPKTPPGGWTEENTISQDNINKGETFLEVASLYANYKADTEAQLRHQQQRQQQKSDDKTNISQ
jgi:hypothetical protein